jgi:hypothetical protein
VALAAHLADRSPALISSPRRAAPILETYDDKGFSLCDAQLRRHGPAEGDPSGLVGPASPAVLRSPAASGVNVPVVHVSHHILALLLLAELPPGKAGESPPWSNCGRQLDASGLDKWRHAPDLARTRQKMSSSPRGKRTWTEQMTSRGPEDRLGRELPRFVTREAAIAWTEHPRPDTVHLVTARRWPGVPGERWVVLVAAKAGPASESYTDLIDVRLALIEVTGTGPGEEPSVRRIARSTSPLLPCADWAVLPEDFWPFAPDEDACNHAAGIADSSNRLAALDFAPYQIARAERAFGLRTQTGESYGGGFGSFETLTLFRVDGEVLQPILDVPVGMTKMVAGLWNDNGTRQHRTLVADLLLQVRPRGKAMADLLLRSRRSRDAIVFTWDQQRQAYGCGSKRSE